MVWLVLLEHCFPIQVALAVKAPRVRLRDVFPSLPQSKPEPAALGTSPVCLLLALIMSQ